MTCWYSFELPQQVKVIQMSTNNICFDMKVDKAVIWRLWNSLTVHLEGYAQ